jgi:hypothetical protein
MMLRMMANLWFSNGIELSNGIKLQRFILYTLASLSSANPPTNFIFMHMCKLETKPFEHICRNSYHYQVRFYGAYPNPNIELKMLDKWHKVQKNLISISLYSCHQLPKKGRLKGPCLVFVIEWQLRWTNMWLCEIHMRLVHRWWCHEGGYCTWDMTWSHVTKVEKIKMRLGLMVRLLGWRTSCDGLAPKDRGNGEEQVRSRSMNQYGHVMIWSGSYHLWYGWCMCCINVGGDGVECARQRYNLGNFYFTGHRCVEKLMTGFRIDGRTIKRGKLICILVI